MLIRANSIKIRKNQKSRTVIKKEEIFKGPIDFLFNFVSVSLFSVQSIPIESNWIKLIQFNSTHLIQVFSLIIFNWFNLVQINQEIRPQIPAINSYFSVTIPSIKLDFLTPQSQILAHIFNQFSKNQAPFKLKWQSSSST
jgi:hypothetical protein